MKRFAFFPEMKLHQHNLIQQLLEVIWKSKSILLHCYYRHNSHLWGKIEQKCTIDLSSFLPSFLLFPHLSFLVCRYSITLSFRALGKATSVFLRHSLHPRCLSPRMHVALLSQNRSEKGGRNRFTERKRYKCR